MGDRFMATCPMCNTDVADDQMDQHKQETHPEAAGEGQQPQQTPPPQQ